MLLGDVNVTDTINEFQDFQPFYKIFIDTNVEENYFNTPRDILKFLVTNPLCPSFQNLSMLLQIFFCLPVTSAGAERSFCRMKLQNAPSLVTFKNLLKQSLKNERMFLYSINLSSFLLLPYQNSLHINFRLPLLSNCNLISLGL